MKEIYKDIEGYEDYQISNLGNVKSLPKMVRSKRSKNGYRITKERILQGVKDRVGYTQVKLCKEGKMKGYLVHRLVAMAFIPNPENLPQVNHKDENKENNRVTNLEWCTRKYNVNYGTGIQRRVANTDYKAISKARTAKMDYKAKVANTDYKAIAAKIDYKAIAEKNSKKVQCVETGIIYSSATMVERELKYNKSSISECCKGKRKSCGGFHWKYID